MLLSKRGIPLTSEKKAIIISLKYFFDKHKSDCNFKEPSVEFVADALDIGLATVNRVLAEYKKDPVNIYKETPAKGRPQYSIENTAQEQVRAYIRSANLKGKFITLETIRDFLSQAKSDQSDFHLATLARTLDRWGFEYGKGTRTQHLKEKDYVIAARRRYLRHMKNNRDKNSHEKSIRPEVYLDESYVNKNHTNDLIWYSVADGPWVQKPTGNGERLIIMNAITKDGWVPGAKVVFKSDRKTGDYHGQMNGEIFKKWFTDKLIPNIPKNSIIVMDNASYHNILAEYSAPIESSSKKFILKWLEQNKIPCTSDCVKAELIEILKKLAPEPTYELNEIAAKSGHEVVRTPPYHPELQPIEICWGVVKNEVARNCDFTMKNLELQLEHSFSKVTKDTCSKIIKKIKGVEDKFWQEDKILDVNLEEK